MQIKDSKFRLKLLIGAYLITNLGLGVANLVQINKLIAVQESRKQPIKAEEVKEAVIQPIEPEKPVTEAVVPVVTAKPVPEQKPNKPKNVSHGTNGLPSQSQKDATEAVCGKSYANHEAELTEANVSKGLYMETCYYDLLAIARHESGFNNNAVGDHGKAHGPFQINSIFNPSVTLAQARDYSWSANWTIERMHRFGYPVKRSLSIKAHNGLGGNGSYESAVKATAAKYLSMGL